MRCLSPPPPHTAVFLAVTRCHWGSFWEIFGSLKPADRCAAFVRPTSDGSASCGRDSPGSEIRGALGGAGGPFRRSGTSSVFWGLNRQKTVSAVTRRHSGSFREIVGSAEPSSIPQFSYSDNIGWRNSRFTGFWGFGGLTETSQPRLGPKTGQKHPKAYFPGLGVRSGRTAHRPNLIAC